MIVLSVIVPTCNRAEMLCDALDSLIDACADVATSSMEVIIIDNGSSDNTRAVVDTFSRKAPFSVMYCYEPCPGLHVGRNLGAQMAKGDVLAYLDDDVLVEKGWAKAIIDSFSSDEKIAILGGPCLPHWETEAQLPVWLESFRTPVENGWCIGPLSLLDYGKEKKVVPAMYLNGCNFSIRKEALFDAGGFHPDGMPAHLLKYRGDGESGVGRYVDGKGKMTALYDPAVIVLHRVPGDRLTKEYFLSHAKRGSYGHAYYLVRSLWPSKAAIIKEFFLLWSRFVWSLCGNRWCSLKKNDFLTEYWDSTKWHVASHFSRILFDVNLRQWVLQPTYYLTDPCPYYHCKEERIE